MATLPAIASAWLLGAGMALASEPDTILVEEATAGSFQRAVRLSVTPQGALYVVDAEANSIVSLDARGKVVATIGGYGWTSGTFDRPTSVTTDGLNVYVADFANHRIQRFDRYLNFISSLSTRDTNVVQARFGAPAGAALSRLGDLFILDTENMRVVKFNGRSQYERSFGGLEQERGRIRRPVKVVVTPSDRVFVLEPDRVLEFDFVGNFIKTIGEGILHGAIGLDATNSAIVVAMADTIHWFTHSGQLRHSIPVRFILSSLPLAPVQDIAVTRDRFYILGGGRVHVFRRTEGKE